MKHESTKHLMCGSDLGNQSLMFNSRWKMFSLLDLRSDAGKLVYFFRCLVAKTASLVLVGRVGLRVGSK